MKSDLERFVRAQNGVLHTVVAELESGRKRSHWMWFIFPQVQGLGHSEQAQKYAIHDLEEARDYLNHPLLGPRLEQVTRILLGSATHSREVLGDLDFRKFISCMTLFMLVSPADSIFALALQKLSATDNKTREILGVQS